MHPRSIALLGLAVLVVTACDPFRTGFAEQEPVKLYRAGELKDAQAPSGPLTVMSWNIKYGGARLLFFWECRGDRYDMTEREVTGNMAKIAAKIREVNPDVLLLQEIDVKAKRAAYVDQVQYLLDHTDLNYGAYASQWKADYVPTDGVGPVDSGSAVLSRWPITEGTRYALPLISDWPVHEQYFYLHRNVMEARLDIPSHPLWVVNTHSEAFSTDGTKQKHLEGFQAVMDALDDRGEAVLAGGDLNSLPKGSPSRTTFVDDCDDAMFEGDSYEGEEDWLDAFYTRYQPAVSLEDFAADPAANMTFVGGNRARAEADGWEFFWNRKLDYLFTNARFTAAVVHQDERTGLPTLDLSDHAPVVATLELQ